MDKEILIAEELAAWLRIDIQRVYELCRQDAIPFILLGRKKYRFSKQEIEKWLQNGGSDKGGVKNDGSAFDA